MAKPKPVNWELIEDHDLYNFVGNIINTYYNEINDIVYVLMWRYNVKPDQDGYLLLADISKSSDKMRELRPHDVIIGINKDIWNFFDDDQKSMIIDHQLQRVAKCVDKEGEPKEDDRSRPIYRLRRKEVLENYHRYNTTMRDVQEYILNKLQLGGAEENSYVGNVLTGESCDD